MKKWLFNPFVYVAGGRALATGLGIMLATAVICYFSNTHFDGVLAMHTGGKTSFALYLLEGTIDWSYPVILFYIAGLIFSGSRIRLIDVAGTFALARWVMIFPAIIGFGMHAPDVQPETVKDIMAAITPMVIALSVVSLIFIVWLVALMYNAFTVSCNIKGTKGVIVFIAVLIISEFLAGAAIHGVYHIYH